MSYLSDDVLRFVCFVFHVCGCGRVCEGGRREDGCVRVGGGGEEKEKAGGCVRVGGGWEGDEHVCYLEEC